MQTKKAPSSVDPIAGRRERADRCRRTRDWNVCSLHMFVAHVMVGVYVTIVVYRSGGSPQFAFEQTFDH